MGVPNILLLIDDPVFRGGLLPALRAKRLGTLLTGDGDHARALISRGGVSIIVVDARIPGEGGLAWLRARRAAGLAIPVVLCASTKEEMKTFLGLAHELNIASVVSRSVKPEDFAAHIVDLLAEMTHAPEPDPEPTGNIVEGPAPDLGNDLEKFRQSMQRLQQDPERRERMESALAVAQTLLATANRAGDELAYRVAKRASEILGEGIVGRRRMDQGAFSEIERLLARARGGPGSSSVSTPGMRLPTAPAVVRKSAAAYEPQTDPGLRRVQDIDELTGVLTRAGFEHDADEMVGGAMIDGRPLTFCVIALSGAEELQRSGRLDAALAATGRFLAARFRPVDRRGRWGAATFALAFPGTPTTMAADLLARTFEAFKSVRITDASGARFEVELGGGIATYPKDAKTADALLAIAERQALGAVRR